jgi:lysozyme family protein
MTSLDTLIEKLLDREGGVADVGDGKGVTRFGQTPDWLDRFNLPAPKTRDEAHANYLRWIGLIKFGPLLEPGDDLADILLDIAVMSDHTKAIKALQAVLGITVDGVLGPVTLEAMTRQFRPRLARLVIAWDMQYQGRIITLNPDRAKFAAGWANRMAEHVRNLT